MVTSSTVTAIEASQSSLTVAVVVKVIVGVIVLLSFRDTDIPVGQVTLEIFDFIGVPPR